MVRLIDANELIRYIVKEKRPGYDDIYAHVIWMINEQPHIMIDKVNTLDEVKQRGVFVARKEK